MVSIEIHHTTAIKEREWENMLSSSDDAWLWHSYSWMQATAEVHSLQNHYFIATEGGRRIGGFPIQCSRTGSPLKWASSLLMGAAGPFCVRDGTTSMRRRLFSELTQSVINWAREMNIEVLNCLLPPLARSNLENTRGVNPLYLAGWDDMSSVTLISNLSRPEYDLWLDLSHDARQQVNRAMSSRYVVQRADWWEMLNEYYRVHVETYKRTGVTPHPKLYFEAIAKSAEQGHAVLWAALDPGGRAVAFHNDARYRDGEVYNTGCCETEHLRSGINYLLFWKAIMGAKEDGCRWYDLGEVFPHVKVGKVRGLTLFKQKFGGELYRYYRGQIRLIEYPTLSDYADSIPNFLMPVARLAVRRILRPLITRRKCKTLGR